MFLRRHKESWGDTTSATAAVAPGAHDLLATDAGGNGSSHKAVGCRSSASLQVTSSDLAVGKEEFHVFQEQTNELFSF